MRAIEVAGDDGIDVAKKDKAGALAFTLLDLCHTHANKLLSVAIEHDNTRMVDELLERRFYNTDFYAAGDKEDPLSLAVAKNNMHACSRLLTIAGFMKCDLLPTFVLAPSTSPLRLLLKSSWIHSHVAAAMEIAINGGAAEAVELLRSYDAANGLNSELDCSWYITKTRAARNWSAIELLVRDTERPVLPDGDLTEIFDRCVIALNRPMAWVILRHMHHRLQLKEVLTVENLMFLLRAKPFEMLEPHVKALTDTGLCKIADVEAAVKLLWDGATALKELHFTLVITGSISQTFIDESFVEAARTRNWKLGQILIETERVGVELLKKWTPFIVGFRALTVLAQAGAVHTLPALVAVLGCSSRNDNRGLLRAMKIFQRCKSSLFEFAYRREDFPDIGLPVMHTAGRLYGELVRNDSTSLPTFRRVYRVLLDLGWGLDVDHGLILFCENEDQELVDLVLESIPSLVNTVVRWAIRKGKLEVAAKTLLQKHINTKKGVLFKSDDD
ncbi:hypothetical protein HK101_000201 [Irineochytrium annulatum]|nr:hypothetical protein HK101_000201 [Irineochytrium annulatum]